jgi:hypothetical protein
MSFKLTIPFDLGRGLARISNIKALFTTLSDAFDEATGHTHDGSAGQGAPIADTTALVNADADAYKPGFISADADGRGLIEEGAIQGDKLDAGIVRVELVDGQDETGDATIPVTGTAEGDELVAVFVYATKAAIGTKTQRALADFTGPAAGNLTVVANKANNAANLYEIWWLDKTP